MNVAFCGHAAIFPDGDVENWLCDITEMLIQQGASTFYLGGYGNFDRLAVSVLQRKKKIYPHIQRILVLPYLDMKYDPSGYDGTIYPPLESVPRRFAISHRNRWMINYSEVLVAYVLHDWGRAATTLQGARKKGKQIILYPDKYCNEPYTHN